MFSSASRVTVYPYSAQQEGDEIIIGRPGGEYIAIPTLAIEILRDLGAGRTLGETQQRFHERHGEQLDLEDFVAELARRGFVAPAGPPPVARDADRAAAADGRDRPRAHAPLDAHDPLTRAARLLFSWPVIAGAFALIAAGAIAAAIDPAIVPGRRALLFARHRTLTGSLLLMLTLGAIWVHEMAHVLAARAAGIKTRINISHRLWVLVAETDLSALWGLPKRKRYLPLLAGWLVDLTSAGALLLVLAASRKQAALPPAVVQFIQAFLFVTFMRILWQCYFFLRTDLYYVLSAFAGCKNLMADAEALLRNIMARLLPAVRRVDQSAIPRRERTFIGFYAAIWLAGRAAALAVLVLVTVPVAAYYLRACASALRDHGAHPLAVFDAFCIAAAFLIPLLAGFSLWARSLVRAWRIGT
jgi:putative peptide zinc metalloprotease protein